MSADGIAPLPRAAAIVGAGEIGSGWAALFASRGVAVRIFDRDASALARARTALGCARALISDSEGASIEAASIEATVNLESAVAGADWVQESLPELPALKRDVLARLDRCLDESAIVASSSSSYTASEMGAGRPFAARFIIAHPLHPVYAVPVVELCAGRDTSDATVRRAAAVLRALGREPVVIGAELPGLVANRLTAALLREAFDLVARGAVSAGDLDRVVSRGVALGWAAHGPLRTEAIGAGGSFDEFLTRFGEALPRLWSALADWRDLDPAGRESLRRAVSADAGNALSDTANAHGSGECSWAKTLARLARVAEMDV